MKQPHRSPFPAGEWLALVSAILMLVAFLFLPWFHLEELGTVSGIRLVADPELDLPRDVTTAFLLLVPLAAIFGGVAALQGMRTSRSQTSLQILLIGIVGVFYHQGAFLIHTLREGAPIAEVVGSGFVIALLGAVGLIVQAFIPRARADETEEDIGEDTPPSGLRDMLGRIPTLAYLIGMLGAILLEKLYGEGFADTLGFRNIPKFFGIVDIIEPFSDLDFSGILAPFFPGPTGVTATPIQDALAAIGTLVENFVSALFYQDRRNPGFFDLALRVSIYDIVVFVIPIILIALLLDRNTRRLLRRVPRWAAGALHVVVIYAAVMLWGGDGGTRELVLMFMGINIMLSVSLNLVNGYMGEFSVGHAGFMAVGAYVSSILTMWVFADDRVFGDALLQTESGIVIAVGFIIALVAGGIAAALAGLLVAFPSFRTRGDYLAIVTLAVNFIVQGVINNIEVIGGARGLNGVPLWTNLNWVVIATFLSLAAIYFLVNSTFGKGIIAIREDEIAADLMGVNTRHLKLVAFMVSSFIAGVAGGLFAHALAYVNPGMFGILKSTEALVMVYLGGMGSISGSIIAAVIFTVMLEALRPLAVLKWVIIPLTLILLMLYRPQGLLGFRELKFNLMGGRTKEKEPTPTSTTEASDGAAGNQ